MVNTTAAHQHTGGDPNQPCGKCHKRHVRAGEGVATSSSQPSNKNRRGLYLSSSPLSIKKTAGIAALFLLAITHPASAAAVTGSQPSSTVVASEASRQHIFDGTAMSSVLASLWGDMNHKKFTNNNRFLQVEEDDHDHDHADEIHSAVVGSNETDLHDVHADEHHDESGHADEHVEGIIDEHHDEHDHADEHDDHGHGDVHDDHGDEHDDHGDVHDDHGHGDVSAYFITASFSLYAYILLTPFLISPATY